MQVNTDMQTVLFNLGADTSLKPHAIMPVGDIVMVFTSICSNMSDTKWYHGTSWLKPIAQGRFSGNVHGFVAVSIFSKPVCYWKLRNADNGIGG
ncbi:MAG: hypothetical protein ACLTLY_02970 [Agathobacter rectalis]